MLDPAVERTICDLLDAAFVERDGPLRQARAEADARASLAGRFGSGAHREMVLQAFRGELRARADKALSATLDTLKRLKIALVGASKEDVTAFLEATLRQQRGKLEAILLEGSPFKQGSGSRYPATTQAPASYLNDTLGAAMRSIEAQLAVLFLEAKRAAHPPAPPNVPVLDRPAMAGPITVTVTGDGNVVAAGHFPGATVSGGGGSLTPEMVQALVDALGRIEQALAQGGSIKGADSGALTKALQEAREEVSKPTPDKGKLGTILGGVAKTVQTTGALKGAYEVVSGIAKFLGYPLP